ncbi:MAG: GNAT family N-acetyltransferase [Pseudomonadota bacterium]
MTNENNRYPTSVTCEEHIVTLRLMTPEDETNLLTFAQELPPHDLLYMPRDITNAKVISAWMRTNEKGHITTILATDGDEIVGCAALFQDPYSWSPHYAEMRVLVGKKMRAKGLGRILIQECFVVALAKDLKKLSAQMTVDQQGAVTIFEELGFRGEALLKDQVMDRDGETHDIVILSCDIEQVHAQLAAYGLDAMG